MVSSENKGVACQGKVPCEILMSYFGTVDNEEEVVFRGGRCQTASSCGKGLAADTQDLAGATPGNGSSESVNFPAESCSWEEGLPMKKTRSAAGGVGHAGGRGCPQDGRPHPQAYPVAGNRDSTLRSDLTFSSLLVLKNSGTEDLTTGLSRFSLAKLPGCESLLPALLITRIRTVPCITVTAKQKHKSRCDRAEIGVRGPDGGAPKSPRPLLPSSPRRTVFR